MKRVLFVFCLLSASAFAGPTAKVGIRSGIRKNTIDTNFTSSLDVSADVHFKKMHLNEIQSFFHVQWHPLFLEVEGSYGWFDKAVNELQMRQDLSLDLPTYSVDFKTRGEQISLVATTGIPFNWGKNISLAPIGGYRFDRHEISQKDPDPDLFKSLHVSPFSSFITRVSPSKRDFRQEWKGPFVGGQMTMTRGHAYIFLLRYAYHFLHVREKNSFSTEYLGKDDLGNRILDLTYDIFKQSKTEGHGHELTYRWIYRLDRHWDFGFQTEYLTYKTKWAPKANLTITEGEETLISKENPTRARFDSYSLTMEISKRY